MTQLGHWEDQFFSTVFFGSGILLIAMLFVSGALGGALIDIYTHSPRLLQDSGVYAVNRARSTKSSISTASRWQAFS
ncbi:MAG: hypothetical protein R2838_02620 [Caldilineaceae bacterium]